MGKYYYTIKEDPLLLQKERDRVKNILNNRYKEDSEYRERCKEYSRLYRLKKKEMTSVKTDQNDINI